MFTPSFRKPNLRFGAKTLTALIGASLVTASFLPLSIAPASANDSATTQDMLSDFLTDDKTGDDRNVLTTSTPSLPQDAGISMPEKGNEPKKSGAIWLTPEGSSETTGDVLGLGYEQSITFTPTPENGKGKITVSKPASSGGKEALKDPFDTNITSGWPIGTPTGGSINRAGLLANQIAVAPGHQSIYVTETANTEGSYGFEYKSYISRYVPDGDGFKEDKKVEVSTQPQMITAMDAIVYKGKKYLAVGFNLFGVTLLDGDTLQPIRSFYQNWGNDPMWGGSNTVSAVKLGVDENDRLLLATGRFTYNDHALYVSDALNGDLQKPLWVNNYRRAADKWQWPSVLAFGRTDNDNKVKLAVGWPGTSGDNDHVSLLEAAGDGKGNSHELGSLDLPQVPGYEKLPTVLKFFKNSEEKNMLGVVYGDKGAVLGTNASGSYDLLVASSEKETVTAQDLVTRYVPGYRPVFFNVSNEARENLRVQLHSSPLAWKGCWLNTGLKGGKPFPDRSISLPTSGVTGMVSMAQITAGPQNGCGKNKGTFFVEVEQADGIGRQVAKIVVTEDGTLTIDDEKGNGQYQFSIHQTNSTGSVLGGWSLSVTNQQRDSVTVNTTPTLDAKRLTPAVEGKWEDDRNIIDDPRRPVYRFTVGGASWNVPGADNSLTETQLPAIRAQGSTNGIDWDDLGTVISSTQATRDGNIVKLGQGSFDWQTNNAPNSADYKQYRVVAGDVPSNVITVETVPAPPPSKKVTNVTVTTPTTAVLPNGLDQAKATFTLTGPDNAVLDPNEYKDLYDRVYFRNEKTKSLVTGLRSPENPNRSVAVSFIKGAYTDETSDVKPNSKEFYISTTNPAPIGFAVTFKPTGEKPQRYNDETPTTIVSFPTAASVGSNEIAAGGSGQRFSVSNQYKLAAPTSTNPVVYGVDDSTVGIQLRSRATIGSASLPLGDETPAHEQPLGSSGLNISEQDPTVAKLLSFDTFPKGTTFTTNVVARGTRVLVYNLKAKP